MVELVIILVSLANTRKMRLLTYYFERLTPPPSTSLGLRFFIKSSFVQYDLSVTEHSTLENQTRIQSIAVITHVSHPNTSYSKRNQYNYGTFFQHQSQTLLFNHHYNHCDFRQESRNSEHLLNIDNLISHKEKTNFKNYKKFNCCLV